MSVCKHCDKPISPFECDRGKWHIHNGTRHPLCNPHADYSTIATPKEAS